LRRGLRLLAMVAWLLAAVRPAGASRWLALANGERDTAVLSPEGEVEVFTGFGEPIARRSFGPGCLGLAGAPRATLIAVLRRTDRGSVQVWDYAADRLTPAPADGVADALAMAFAADGRSLFVASAAAQAVREVGDFLTPQRLLAAAGLTPPRSSQAPLLALEVSPQNLFIGLAGPDAVYLGSTQGRELLRYEVSLSALATPSARFSRDARWLVAGGDSQLVAISTAGGLPRRLALGGIPATPAFDLSSDGRTLFLADGGRVAHLNMATGALVGLGLARAEGGRPRDGLVSAALGTFIVAFEDGHVAWYEPAKRKGTVYPPLPGEAPPAAGPPAGLPLGPTPAVAPPPTPPRPAGPAAPHPALTPTALLSATAGAMRDPALLVADKACAVVVLDQHYTRLTVIEQAAARQGWQALVLALVAVWSQRPDLVPGDFGVSAEALGKVDLVEIRSGHPAPTADPTAFEATFGPGVATEIQRMSADGRLRPVYRFGPFGLLVDVDARRFPAGATLWLGPELVKDALGR